MQASWNVTPSARRSERSAIIRQILSCRLTARTTRRILRTSLTMPKKPERVTRKRRLVRKTWTLTLGRWKTIEDPRTMAALRTSPQHRSRSKQTRTKDLQLVRSESLVLVTTSQSRQARLHGHHQKNGSHLPQRPERRPGAL